MIQKNLFLRQNKFIVADHYGFLSYLPWFFFFLPKFYLIYLAISMLVWVNDVVKSPTLDERWPDRTYVYKLEKSSQTSLVAKSWSEQSICSMTRDWWIRSKKVVVLALPTLTVQAQTTKGSNIIWHPWCKGVSVRQLGGRNAMLTRLSGIS